MLTNYQTFQKPRSSNAFEVEIEVPYRLTHAHILVPPDLNQEKFFVNLLLLSSSEKSLINLDHTQFGHYFSHIANKINLKVLLEIITLMVMNINCSRHI